MKQTLHVPAPRVLAALKGDKTMSELATQFDVHPNQIKQWKDQLLNGVTDLQSARAIHTPDPKPT